MRADIYQLPQESYIIHNKTYRQNQCPAWTKPVATDLELTQHLEGAEVGKWHLLLCGIQGED